MNLVSMAVNREDEIVKERRSLLGQETMDKPKYPYGTRITIEDPHIAKLGFLELPEVGKEMMLMAKVIVKSVADESVEDNHGGRRIELQLTDMMFKAEEEKEERTPDKVLFGE